MSNLNVMRLMGDLMKLNNIVHRRLLLILRINYRYLFDIYLS